MRPFLFLHFLRKLPRHPKLPLVVVIDTLDECGDNQSRPVLLWVLTDVSEHAPWLKIIITKVDTKSISNVSSMRPCDII